MTESVVIPNDSIRVSKTTYEELHYKVEENKEKSPKVQEK